jgi:PAS domain S-box-containing protein
LTLSFQKAADNSTSERPAFLSTEAAEPRTYRLAKTVALITLLVFIAAVPFVRIPLSESRPFIASYESTLAINDLVTASLLAAQFAIMRSRALLVLACGYLFTAAIVIPHALSFPGLFAPGGLIGAGSQATPWLYIIWHAGFPLFVMAYALLKKSENQAPGVSSRFMIFSAVIAVLATVCVLTLIVIDGGHFLPVVVVDERFTLAFSVIAGCAWVLSLAALILLLSRKPYSVLDVWLAVTMCAWLCDIALGAVFNAGRFDLGYYAGQLFGLLASTFVLLMLLRETVVLYARVVCLLEAEQHERRRDIAERRRLFETSLDLILVVDCKGVIGRVNPSCMPILGYTPEEMMGRRAVEFLFAADRDATRAEMLKVRSGEIMRNFLCRYVRKDCVIVTIAWTGLWSEPDQMYFFFGRDMTEQKLTEKKFQLAVESCPNGMLMSDADGTIRLVNAETELMFGYSREELIGKSVDILVPPALRGKQTQYRIGYMAHSEPGLSRKEYELIGLRKDGTEFPIEVALNSIQTPEGLLVLTVVIDVTERKRIERLKDEFVSTVSHELRTPLTSIGASLSLLARNANTQLPDSVVRLITIAHSNSQRLVRLVNDILDIEKIESGKMVFNLARIDVRCLVEHAIDASQGFAQDHGVSLRLDPRSTTGEVAADSDRLTQILTNLISNAVKFSPRGEEVVVAIKVRDGNVRVSVRDHGSGIPDEFKSRIFEKFAQADASDSRQKGGTGLGLSIVKQLAVKLGGEVGFKDAPGGGTIFYLDLPRLEPQVARDFPQDIPHGQASEKKSALRK